ncbi:TetR/AcrR family transcriptional regulator [Saccharopolyspora sp. K220]|uniref:TetR/AcrR family transcriptional regulator n=1 Tax=Saccharopolyspora soli TaxID=2926618 RepID=UPI001F5873E5|nr:TetR/AcrR family transcriptional regulator [Saccharopolyspora soli]MCI2419827.1 TetR/AcrR family transcriptional regulator [Saccharopolyspora soli]
MGTQGRVGRPRAGSAGTGDSREDLLAAGAALFTERGFAATSTRALAERAGLRQAALYHYFETKEDILAALLERTVRPSAELASALLGRAEDPAVRLWALCRADIELLAGGEHNLGALYLLPEVAGPRFAEFRRQRAELKDAYRVLVEALAGPQATGRADFVFGVVESVILIRREETGLDPVAFAAAGADAALRAAGVSDDRLCEVRRAGEKLLGTP